MQKEAKWNLVFLTLLIILLIPGAVILVNKKLDPKSHRMGGPDPVRRTTAYIDPFDVPEDFRRLVPPKADAWTTTLGQTYSGRTPENRLSYKGQPIVSEARQFEVLDYARNPEGIQFVALIWNLPEDKPPSEVKAKAAVGKDAVDPLRIKTQTLSVPEDVLEEFRTAGFIRPGQHAELVIVQFPDLPDPTAKKPAELMLQVYQNGPTKPDFVRLFTSPEAATQPAR